MEASEVTKFAIQLADKAGEIARRYFRSSLEVIAKDDASPVTIADREIESAIAGMIAKKYPDHGIYGEEHGRINANATYQWVIDPIDGTRAFIAGIPTFTTLIALCEDDIPILGIIDQPISGERWVGATPSGVKITTKRNTALRNAAIGTTSAPYYFSTLENARFNRLRAQCAHTIIGGDAYGYAMLATGQLDLFADTCMKPYDFCALVPVVQAAGGVITDWAGKPLTLHSDGTVLAAANAELHKQALELLND
jgi:inositol-phosphate phosphatase/L-galactose 1-phosphate phosphatase/histidinol-phosphatase